MSDEKKAQPQAMKLKIDLDDEMAQGAYTNLTFINHNETEFVLDFVYVQPNQPKAKVRSRVIMSPQHARRFMNAFQRNLDLYEKKFGDKAKPAPPKSNPPDDDTLIH